MHQLSFNHTFAAPQAAPHTPSAAVAARVGDGSPAEAGHAAAVTPAPAHSPAAAGSDPCLSGCDGHTMLVVTRLLALTLLVTTWLLRPPGSRRLPSSRTLRLPVTPSVGRRRPALTLAELAVRRT